jgi:hypothetical protein
MQFVRPTVHLALDWFARLDTSRMMKGDRADR